MTLFSLTLANRTATTLSVTWSAGYPKCYSFTVSHSTQDGSINVTQPAENNTSHTLTSLQPGTTCRIEVEAVRKGDRVDGQKAKVMTKFPTATTSECLQWDAFRGYKGAYGHLVIFSPTLKDFTSLTPLTSSYQIGLPSLISGNLSIVPSLKK